MKTSHSWNVRWPLHEQSALMHADPRSPPVVWLQTVRAVASPRFAGSEAPSLLHAIWPLVSWTSCAKRWNSLRFAPVSGLVRSTGVSGGSVSFFEVRLTAGPLRFVRSYEMWSRFAVWLASVFESPSVAGSPNAVRRSSSRRAPVGPVDVSCAICTTRSRIWSQKTELAGSFASGCMSACDLS